MYRSRPVERMRDEPIPDEEVRLVIELGNVDRAAVEAVLADAGGRIERELQFADLVVRVPETAVADLCALEIPRIETGETISQVPEGAEE